jgi:hypothetical protein
VLEIQDNTYPAEYKTVRQGIPGVLEVLRPLEGERKPVSR